MNNSNDPLQGIKLEQMLLELEDTLGWEQMGYYIKIRCFNDDPSIKSSLQFLRKTPWARDKVEALYVRNCSNKGKRHSAPNEGKTSTNRKKISFDTRKEKPSSSPKSDPISSKKSSLAHPEQSVWGKLKGK